ncbi:MAG: prepilin-type N-terminal cleavage/methylation domain-containing protein [Clostridia bacterium]
MIKIINNKKGFTLVEIVVALAITMIIMWGAVNIFFSFYNYYCDAQVQTQQQTLVDNIADILSEEMRYSTSVVIDEETEYSNYTGYNYIYSENGCIYRNGTLLLDVSESAQEIALEFDYVTTTSYSINVTLTVTSTNNFGGTTTENFSIKMINMELKEVPIDKTKGTTSGTNCIYYK